MCSKASKRRKSDKDSAKQDKKDKGKDAGKEDAEEDAQSSQSLKKRVHLSDFSTTVSYRGLVPFSFAVLSLPVCPASTLDSRL